MLQDSHPHCLLLKYVKFKTEVVLDHFVLDRLHSWYLECHDINHLECMQSNGIDFYVFGLSC